nr:hypothetical protein [Tanacetum cinerariifolium]
MRPCSRYEVRNGKSNERKWLVSYNAILRYLKPDKQPVDNDNKPDEWYYEMEAEEHIKEVAALRKLEEEYDYEHDPEYDSGDDSFECLDYDELHLARLAEKSPKLPR